MTQHDYVIANADGATVRADMNVLNQAIAELNSGASAPTTTFAYMYWADTTTGILKQRNAANTAWITKIELADPVSSFVSGILNDANAAAFRASIGAFNDPLTTRGDVLVVDSVPNSVRLAKGANNTVLTANALDVLWAKISGSMIDMGSDANGDILIRSGGIYVRLPKGAIGTTLKMGATLPAWALPGIVALENITGAQTTYDFTTTIDSTYRSYLIKGWVQPVTDDVELWLRTDANGGASFDAGASDYRWGWNGFLSSTSTTRVSAADTKIIAAGGASGGGGIGNATNERVSFEILIEGPSDSAFDQTVKFRTWGESSDNTLLFADGAGVRNSAAIVDAIQLLFESGNVADGNATLYGMG